MSESNFATKLQLLKDLRNACNSMAGYAPIQALISLAGMLTRISDIETINAQINTVEATLPDKQAERELKVHGQIEDDGLNGIIRRSRQVASYVDGTGEPFETEAVLIRRLVNKMQPSNTRRPSTGPEDRTRSTSEQSYASITANATKVLRIIIGMNAGGVMNYNPADAEITIANYTTLINEIKTLSNQIGDISGNLKALQNLRRILYNRPADGIRKILSETKKYVRGNYGFTSAEYNAIKLLKY